ncbi:MAG: hypothetical protein R2729_15245 [Bryobacteraceae bacterium]
MRPRRVPRHQQVRHVRARDQQQQACRGEQEDDRLAAAGGQPIALSPHRRAWIPLAVGIGFGEPRRDSVQVRCGLPRRNPGLQTAHHIQHARTA